MKRILTGALAALLSFSALAATLNPIQLLNPAGSTSGQAITSTGPTTPPHWSTITLDGISGFTTTGFLYRNSANSYVIITPPIIQGVGGTGLSTLGAHQLVVGGSGNAMTPISPGASGTIFSSTGASADPAFQSLATLGIAPLVSPALTGVPTAPTQGAGSNSTAIATTAFVQTSYATPPCIGCTTPNAGAFTAVLHSQQERDTSYSVQLPTTGQTLTIAAGTGTLIMTPAGALAALTITMPQCNAGYDGSLVRFVSMQNVTALTVNSPSTTVVAPATSLTVGLGHAYICRGVATAWYPLY